MRISDWSSDVCSSDLPGAVPGGSTRKGFFHSEARPDGAEPGSTCVERRYFRPARVSRKTVQNLQVPTITRLLLLQIGRASCRERWGKYVTISVGAVSIKKKQRKRSTERNRKKQ